MRSGSVGVATQTRHLDRHGQLGEFEQESNTDLHTARSKRVTIETRYLDRLGQLGGGCVLQQRQGISTGLAGGCVDHFSEMMSFHCKHWLRVAGVPTWSQTT